MSEPRPLPATLDLDAYAPAQIAERVERAGVAKARLPVVQTLALAVLAGAFIAFGGMLYLVAMTEPALGLGPSRLLGGVAFSLGLILVSIAGAELFTGNALMVMALVDGRIAAAELVRNWTIVLFGNAIGGVGAALLYHWAEGTGLGGGKVAATLAAVARAKVTMTWDVAFVRGVLCNALVCLAVWLSLAARDIAGRILAIVFPITAFVALGFEHSIANLFTLPLALLEGVDGVDPSGVLHNLVWVTAGNVVGGAGLVGLVYWVCYRMQREPAG
ncbi:MAG: formate/nitrite transporter family protein [Geminicoccaceae bacterium]